MPWRIFDAAYPLLATDGDRRKDGRPEAADDIAKRCPPSRKGW